MESLIRARVVEGHLVVDGDLRAPEGTEFLLLPVSRSREALGAHAATLLDLLAADLPDEAFTEILDRAKDLPRRDPF